jgi:methionyl aminopeptidase
MQIILKKPYQIDGIRKSCQLAANCLQYIEEYVVAGVSTEFLDNKINEYILKHNAISACLNYKGYPKHTCISLNEVICHGIPSPDTILKEGDILNIDVTTILNGYYGDTSKMYVVGEISDKAKNIIDTVEKCLSLGIEQVVPGKFTGEIGFVISQYAESLGYGVVEYFCGHGTGIHFHESPKIIHKSKPNSGVLLVPRMIFTIEPMINEKSPDVILESDGWTAKTYDGGLSAQCEHTVLVTETGCEILTLPSTPQIL